MVMRQRRRRNSGGFTLIEVMIALVISLVGLLGALGLTISIMNGGTFSRSMTEASTLVQSKLEAVNSQVVTLTSPANGAVNPAECIDAFGTPVNATPCPQYTRLTTWGLTSDGLRRSVLVNVSWADGAGVRHNVSATEERIP
jgi:prepilin-type N-terminal cleavage/methylation domain-containing protein